MVRRDSKASADAFHEITVADSGERVFALRPESSA